MCYINGVVGIRVIGPVPMITRRSHGSIEPVFTASQQQAHAKSDGSTAIIANPALITVKPKGKSTL